MLFTWLKKKKKVVKHFHLIVVKYFSLLIVVEYTTIYVSEFDSIFAKDINFQNDIFKHLMLFKSFQYVFKKLHVIRVLFTCNLDFLADWWKQCFIQSILTSKFKINIRLEVPRLRFKLLLLLLPEYYSVFLF